jgi:hypothetical protein
VGVSLYFLCVPLVGLLIEVKGNDSRYFYAQKLENNGLIVKIEGKKRVIV